MQQSTTSCNETKKQNKENEHSNKKVPENYTFKYTHTKHKLECPSPLHTPVYAYYSLNTELNYFIWSVGQMQSLNYGFNMVAGEMTTMTDKQEHKHSPQSHSVHHKPHMATEPNLGLQVRSQHLTAWAAEWSPISC
jgi:hypothetical protein